MTERKSLGEHEAKLLAELMKNSRRSDRELSRIVGTSQPTVSRMIKKLEQEGYISEYTIMPNFTKLGFNMFSLTFAKFVRTLTDEELQKVAGFGLEMEKRVGYPPAIFVMFGLGLEYDAVVATFHEDYSSLRRFVKAVKGLPLIDLNTFSSFVINLNDKAHVRPLTMSFLANYLLSKSRRLNNHE